MLHFPEAVDKRTLIALLQQANRLAKPLVVTLNERQITRRGHNDIGVELRVLRKQAAHHRQFQPVNRRGERQQLLQLYVFLRQMQAVGKRREMAQRLYKRHVLIVFDRADAVQPRAPDLNLLKEPLVRLRHAAIAVDHHLFSEAAAVRPEHRVQAQYRA